MKLINKTNLCIMSMELIFILAFIKSVNIPIYWGPDWEFIGWKNLFLDRPRNFVALFCLLGFLWSQCVYWMLCHKLKGSPDTLPQYKGYHCFCSHIHSLLRYTKKNRLVCRQPDIGFKRVPTLRGRDG